MNEILNKPLVYLLIALSLVSKPVLGQHVPPYIPIASSEPNASWEDFGLIDHYFEDVQIVGMGESTHGTREFSTMRHRFFRYLVQNHNFNTLFLEADYANCLLANDYVHGGDIDKYKAIRGLSIWPWMTEEMGDLFDWMRTYNRDNPDVRQLSVIGVDMQQYNSTLTAIDNLLIKYGIAITDTSIYKPITNTEFMKLKRKETKPYLSLLEEKSTPDVSRFSAADASRYKLLTRHLKQILEEKSNMKHRAFRDQKMGENILYHLSKNKEIKGLFWAHNYHLFTIYSRDKKTHEVTGYAGGILKANLGDQFLCIVQEFDEGSFNAYYKPGANSKDSEPTGYTLGAVTIEPSIENSFGALFRNTPDAILFIDIEDFNPEPEKYLRQHTIGAQFIAQKDNPNQTTSYNHCTTGCFDAMILIKKSTPTQLIKTTSDAVED